MGKLNKILLVSSVILILGLGAVAGFAMVTRTDLDETQDKLTNAQDQIATLVSRVEQAEDKIYNVETSLAKNQNELADAKNELSVTANKLAYFQGRLDSLLPREAKTEILRPVGPGSETSIDSQTTVSGFHWDKVDEVRADDDGSYINNKNGAAGSWERDLFSLSNRTGSGAITSVRVYIRTRHNISDAKASIRTYETTYDSPGITNGSQWTTYSYAWSKNPYTCAAWTSSEVDNLEAGVSLQGSNGTPDWSDCTQVYVEIAYSN